MGRLEYARYFFTGRKSAHMMNIERRHPKLEGFSRSDSFFSAFGNIGVDFKSGWIIILPARHSFDYENSKEYFRFAFGVFSLWYNHAKMKKEIISK